MLSTPPTVVLTFPSDHGDYQVSIQGRLTGVSHCALVTLHDLGSSHLSMSELFSQPCLTSRSLLIHLSLPGQHPAAPDWDHGQTFPSMQEITESVIHILNVLNLTDVILLGEGLGANLAVRVGLVQPSLVLGLVLVQPVLHRAGILETARSRAVVGELRAGHGKETDHFLLQHAFGDFAQGELLSDKLVRLLSSFRDRIHSSVKPRNLLHLVQSYVKRSDLMCSVEKLRSGAATSSFIKFGRVGNVLLEDPDKAAEAIILFCQGLGKLPSVLGPMTRRISRGVSMTEADKPNIGRLSLSEADA